jgi:hypothetical protein
VIVLNKWDKVDQEKTTQVGGRAGGRAAAAVGLGRAPPLGWGATCCTPVGPHPKRGWGPGPSPAAAWPRQLAPAPSFLGSYTEPFDPLTPKFGQAKATEDALVQLRAIGWATVVCTTASKGRQVDDVVAAILAAGVQHRRRVPTATLNLVVREAVAWKAPPTARGSGRQGRVYYSTQAAVRPPTFVMFVNDPRLFPDDYRRWAAAAGARGGEA